MGFFDRLLGHDWKWYLNKSDKYVNEGDLGEALACVQKAQELSDGTDATDVAIADKLSALKKRIYDKAFAQAQTYLKRGQRETAQSAIERAARYVQTDEERDALNALVDQGNHFEEEDKVVEAHVEGEDRVDGLDVSDKWNLYVTSLSFDKAQHCDNLGDDFKAAWIALQEGAFDEAIEGLEKVYAENPEDGLVMCELGRAYFGKGDADKAAELLEKADNAVDDIDTKLLRTEVMWSQKKYDVAESILQSAHDMDPDNIQVLVRIAQHGLIAKDYDSGIAAAEVLMEKLPQDYSIHRLAGRLYQDKGDEDNALDQFETVNRMYWQVNPQTHKLSFDQPSALAAANIYLKRESDLKRAVELFDAVRANSDGDTHIGACMSLAECYEKMGKNSKRMEMLTEARRIMDELVENAKQGPEKAMMRLTYADICEKCGDTEAGNEQIQEARAFFAADAERGLPVAAFYVQLIDEKIAGKPFPKPDELQERLVAFIQDLRERMAAQRPASSSSFLHAATSMDMSSPVIHVSSDDSSGSSASLSTASFDDTNMRAMARLASQNNDLSLATLASPDENEVDAPEEIDGDSDDSGDSGDSVEEEVADADSVIAPSGDDLSFATLNADDLSTLSFSNIDFGSDFGGESSDGNKDA